MVGSAGCQLEGIIGRLLTDREITDQETDAIKRRLYAFQGVMIARGFQYEDINVLKTPQDIKGLINELTPSDVAWMFGNE